MASTRLFAAAAASRMAALIDAVSVAGLAGVALDFPLGLAAGLAGLVTRPGTKAGLDVGSGGVMRAFQCGCAGDGWILADLWALSQVTPAEA
ncbi:hypothetical protein GCM10025779_25250 [Arthrobacter cryoconiti]